MKNRLLWPASFALACAALLAGCHPGTSTEKTPTEERAQALAFRDGTGRKKDAGQYRFWLEAAANHGDVDSMLELAVLHMKGIGVKADLAQALHWAEKAAQAGNSQAMAMAGALHLKNGDMAKAKAWAEAGIKTDDLDAMKLMGSIHLIEHRVPEALACFRQAAFRGDAEAMLTVGSLYYSGDGGITKDYTKAYEWFLLAAAKDNAHAKTGLGALHHHGYGVPQDDLKAVVFLNAAAMQGDDNAKEKLKEWYGIAKPQEAEQWLATHEASPKK